MQPSGGNGMPPLRYLPSAELERCLPDVETRLSLASRALVALSRGDAEMPAKIGVHPRPGALLHAMPAWLKGADLVGVKWVSAFPNNNERGVPATNALVVLNDPDTGIPTWIMDGSRITAVRTAAVSGVALRLLRPKRIDSIAIIGAGTQARSHIEVIATLAPEAEVMINDVHPERAAALAQSVERDYGLAATAVDDARAAAASSQVVITMARMGSLRQAMTPDWIEPGALVIAVDFATYASAALARAARLFCVDDRQQFLAYRASGSFDDYPDPTTTLGDLIDSASAGNASADGIDARPALVNHLGIGLADVVFADAIAGHALAQGFGMELRR